MLIKSLYFTDKINLIHEKGLFNFENAIRNLEDELQKTSLTKKTQFE